MGATAALPAFEIDGNGLVLTFFVPTSNDRNLRCPFCRLGKQGDILVPRELSPDDYARFIGEVYEQFGVSCISIQGYEPLSIDSLDYTNVIVERASELRIPVGLVTPGVHLPDAMSYLHRAAIDDVSVTLDSIPDVHSERHGAIKALDNAMQGLRSAAQDRDIMPMLSVNSVLKPNKLCRLIRMPATLRGLGLKRWVLGLPLSYGRDRLFNDRRQIAYDLKKLKQESDSNGVEIIFQDEFRLLDSDLIREISEETSRLKIRTFEKSAGIVLLMPTSDCLIGENIILQDKAKAIQWDPKQNHAGDLVAHEINEYSNKKVDPQSSFLNGPIKESVGKIIDGALTSFSKKLGGFMFVLIILGMLYIAGVDLTVLKTLF